LSGDFLEGLFDFIRQRLNASANRAGASQKGLDPCADLRGIDRSLQFALDAKGIFARQDANINVNRAVRRRTVRAVRNSAANRPDMDRGNYVTAR
jgi:hypothetical protein